MKWLVQNRITAVGITIFMFFLYNVDTFGQKNKDGDPTESTGSIHGVVLDSETSTPMPGANVVLCNAVDSTKFNGIVTDNNGNFSLAKIPFGKYYLEVNMVGYEKKRIPDLAFNSDIRSLEMGPLILEPTSIKTSEIEVSAQKESIVYEADKKVYNVEKNIVAAGGSALDVMQTIPNVSVDTEGNISIRGSSNIKVLVDGKPSGLSISSLLQQIPASSIDKVEIINNPSAKYDAEGSSGIINIILKKKMNNGMNALLNLNAGTRDYYAASLNTNYRMDKWNFFGNYDLRSYRMTGNGTLKKQTYPYDSLSILSEDDDFVRKGYYHNFKGGFDYLFDEFNSLTVSGLYLYAFHTGNDFKYQDYLKQDNSLSSYHYRDNLEEHVHDGQEYSLSYKHKYPSKGHELTADAFFSYYTNDEIYDDREIVYNADRNTITTPPLFQNTKADRPITTLILQSDYVRPFEDGSKLEAGLKSTVKRNAMDFVFEQSTAGSSKMIYDSLLSNNFIYDEQIYAGYLTYSGVTGKLKYQAGLRSEYTITDADLKSKNRQFSSSYIDFFPSAFLNYEFEQAHSLNLSYSRRITRPDIRTINPSVQFMDSKSLMAGNPDLKPEYYNSLDLSHTIGWETTTLISTAFFRQTNDLISYYITLKDGIMYRTYSNMFTDNAYGIEFTAIQQLLQNWRFDINCSYYKDDISGTVDNKKLTASNYCWTGRFNTNMNLWEMLDMQFTANYRAPQITPQGRVSEMYWADLGIKASLLEGKAALNLRFTDVFNTMQWSMSDSGHNFYVDFMQKRISQHVYLGFTYKINDFRYRQDKRKEESRKSVDEMG